MTGTTSEGPVAAGRVLMVCLGNICRSPTAEAALVAAAEAAGVALEVASAGTGDWHLGQAPNPPMRAAAAAAGLSLRGVAQQVDAELLGWADLVLAMDHTNLADVRRIAAESGVTTPVRLFRSFDPQVVVEVEGRAPSDDEVPEVPDPYGGGPEGFEEVVRICRRTARAIVATWPDVLHASSNRSTPR